MPRGRQKKTAVKAPNIGDQILSNWSDTELCVICNEGGGYIDHFHEDQLILCDTCTWRGIHIKCYRKTYGDITQEDLESPSFMWFCDKTCQAITDKIRDRDNKRLKLSGTTEFTYEMVRYSASFRPSVTTVNNAVSIFHSAFGPTRYADGTDLVELVCRGVESEDVGEEDDEEEAKHDCRGFFVLVLRKGNQIVSAAAMRVQEELFAEIPYVATKDGYRREGNCRRLMAAIETTLQDLGVQWILMPAVTEIAGMWMKKFGFEAASDNVCKAVESRVLVPDGTDLLIKPVEGPPADLSGTSTVKKAAVRTKKKVTFKPTVQEEESSSSEEDVGEGDDFKVEEEDDSGDDDEEEIELEDENEQTNKTLTTAKKQPAPKTTNTPQQQQPTTTERECYNCATIESRTWHHDDAAGTWECVHCHRYREKHDGKVRPPSTYKQTLSWRPRGGNPKLNAMQAAVGAAKGAVSTGVAAKVGGGVVTPKPILKKRGTGGLVLNRRTSTGARSGQPREKSKKKETKRSKKAKKAMKRAMLMKMGVSKAELEHNKVVDSARKDLYRGFETNSTSRGLADSIVLMGGKLEALPSIADNNHQLIVLSLPRSDEKNTSSVAEVCTQEKVNSGLVDDEGMKAEYEKERMQLVETITGLQTALLDVQQQHAATVNHLTTEHFETIASLQQQLDSSSQQVLLLQQQVEIHQSCAASLLDQFTAVVKEKQQLTGQVGEIQQQCTALQDSYTTQLASKVQELTKKLEQERQREREHEMRLREEAEKVAAVERQAKCGLESELVKAHVEMDTLRKQMNEMVEVKNRLELERQRRVEVEELVKERTAELGVANTKTLEQAAMLEHLQKELSIVQSQQEASKQLELDALKDQLQHVLQEKEEMKRRMEEAAVRVVVVDDKKTNDINAVNSQQQQVDKDNTTSSVQKDNGDGGMGPRGFFSLFRTATVTRRSGDGGDVLEEEEDDDELGGMVGDNWKYTGEEEEDNEDDVVRQNNNVPNDQLFSDEDIPVMNSALKSISSGIAPVVAAAAAKTGQVKGASEMMKNINVGGTGNIKGTTTAGDIKPMKEISKGNDGVVTRGRKRQRKQVGSNKNGNQQQNDDSNGVDEAMANALKVVQALDESD